MPTTLRGTDILFNDNSTQAASAIGFGQTWQNFSSTRAFNTSYTNSTGRSIMICVVVVSAGGAYDPTWVIGGVTIGRFGAVTNNGVYNMTTVIVPPGLTYNLTATSANLSNWYELR